MITSDRFYSKHICSKAVSGDRDYEESVQKPSFTLQLDEQTPTILASRARTSMAGRRVSEFRDNSKKLETTKYFEQRFNSQAQTSQLESYMSSNPTSLTRPTDRTHNILNKYLNQGALNLEKYSKTVGNRIEARTARSPVAMNFNNMLGKLDNLWSVTSRVREEQKQIGKVAQKKFLVINRQLTALDKKVERTRKACSQDQNDLLQRMQTGAQVTEQENVE